MIKGVALSTSPHTNRIREHLLANYDLIEFDPLQIIAQEMATPILLRLGMPIDHMDYTSEKFLSKEYSPKMIVGLCLDAVKNISDAAFLDLDCSIDMGKRRLIVTKPEILLSFRQRGFLTIHAFFNEVIIATEEYSYVVSSKDSVGSALELIDRNSLIPQKLLIYNEISINGRDIALCGIIHKALYRESAALRLKDNVDVRQRSLWIVSSEDSPDYQRKQRPENNYDYCLVADGTIEQIEAAALSLLYLDAETAYIKASEF